MKRWMKIATQNWCTGKWLPFQPPGSVIVVIVHLISARREVKYHEQWQKGGTISAKDRCCWTLVVVGYGRDWAYEDCGKCQRMCRLSVLHDCSSSLDVNGYGYKSSPNCHPTSGYWFRQRSKRATSKVLWPGKMKVEDVAGMEGDSASAEKCARRLDEETGRCIICGGVDWLRPVVVNLRKGTSSGDDVWWLRQPWVRSAVLAFIGRSSACYVLLVNSTCCFFDMLNAEKYTCRLVKQSALKSPAMSCTPVSL